jgi:EAL domain-containing protein (putative c-di-GMP-specific phosphodiesterase class I)
LKTALCWWNSSKLSPERAITLSVRNAWFFRLLIERRLFFKYQPIFHLASGQVVAHECLARATSELGKCLTGKHLIDAAISTQLTCEARRTGSRRLSGIDCGA